MNEEYAHKDTETLEIEPLLMAADLDQGPDGIDIAMLSNYGDTDETRVLLTPEACGLLTSSGMKVAMEKGTGIDVSFTDEAYADYGVKIVEREEALKASVVLSFTPLRAADIRKMSRGASLLCTMASGLIDGDSIKALLEMEITMGCLDNMYSHNDFPVFADIIDEINGRAAIMYAQEHLSFLGGGKGVLLASVAGINPCEVLIIGDGTDVYSAADAALKSGAQVTIVNNDVSMLAEARKACGPNIQTIMIHPRVLYNKVKTADVILLGTTTHPFEFPKNLSAVMKDTAYVLDFKESHPSVSVPRTVAMAISNALVNFLDEMRLKDSFDCMVSTNEGVRQGIVTYRGKLVDKLVGSYTGLPSADLSVMLAGRN
ncbi:MAG: hypothetical protein J5995_01770 [Muribaculaceae bacterium]|nr:hypothetical protein [Muribaculaceae bacterium]